MGQAWSNIDVMFSYKFSLYYITSYFNVKLILFSLFQHGHPLRAPEVQQDDEDLLHRQGLPQDQVRQDLLRRTRTLKDPGTSKTNEF